MSDKVYDILKKLQRLVLPGIGLLYLAADHVWGVAVLTTVIGVLFLIMFVSGLTLQIKSRQYEGNGVKRYGQIVVSTREDGKKIFSLELDKDPSEIEHMDTVMFKVVDKPSEGYGE